MKHDVVRCVRTVVVLCALLAGGWSEVFAQAPSAVRGSVSDESGAILPGVTVTATPAGGGAPTTVVTDGRGSYELSVAPGEYEVRAALPGFDTFSGRLSTTAASHTLDIVLRIAPLTLVETVTVTRGEQNRAAVPNAVSIVDAPQIQFAERKVSPAEALAGTPGLFAENRRNFSMSGGVRLAIRAPQPALGMRGLQIVQDGVPLTTADGTTQPGNIDLGSAGRVEILRGPSSLLYGNSAGGVISVRTEFPKAGAFTILPDVQAGSFGYQRQQLKAEGTAGAVAYVVNASRMQTDGYRQHSRGDVRQANVVLRAQLSPSTELRTTFNLYDLPFGENSSSLTIADARERPTSTRQQAFDQGWGESSTQGQGGVTVEHRFAGGRLFRATGWATWRNVWNPIPSRVIDLGRKAGGFRSEYMDRHQIAGTTIEWTTGFDVSSQHDDRNEFTNAGVATPGGRTRQGALLVDQLEQVRSISPFLQVSVPFHPRWRVTAGARYDYYDFSARDRLLRDGDQSGNRTMDAVSPMIGITHTPTGWLALYANVATAYTTPTTVELSNKPTGEGGFNQDLEPEHLRSVEVGARGLIGPARLRYELSGYRARLTNALVSFQRADEQTYFRNAGESSRNGIEALLEWTPAAWVTGRASYTHQDFTFERFVSSQGNFTGRHEPGAAPNQAFAAAAFQLPFGARATAQMRWVDAYAVNNANTYFNWSYRVVDLRGGFDRKFGGVALHPYFGVDNLFGERYNASAVINAVASRFYEPAPGREIYVGLTVGIGAQ